MMDAENFTEINGLGIHYTVKGQGPAVVLLHGWGGSSKSMDGLQRELARRGFRVYAPDLPGFGKTPPLPRAWSVGDYARLVGGFVESQGKEEFFLFGHSFGGRVAIALASSAPLGLRKLVLCGVPVLREKKVKRFFFLVAAKVLGLVFSLPILSFGKGVVRFLAYRLVGERDYYQAKGAMKETLKKVVSESPISRLGRINVPVLVLWGKKDRVTPFGNALVLEKEIRDVSLAAIEDADHGLPLRRPGKVAEIVAAFLEG